jgi:hypothetical protein
VFERSGASYVSVLAPDGASSGVLFGNPSSNVSGGIIYDQGSVGPDSMQFRTGGNATRMTITQTGDVGIGTTAPKYDVHVRGDSALGTLLVTPGVSDSQAEVRLTENTSASLGMVLRYNGVDNDFELRGFNTGGESDVHFFADRDSGHAGFPSGSSRVGIGTALPAGRLHVVDATGGDGSVRLPSGSISSGEILDEPGIGFDVPDGSTFLSGASTSPAVVASQSITCPSSGYLLVVATFEPRGAEVFLSGFYDFSISKNSTAHNSNNRMTVRSEYAGKNQHTTMQGAFAVGSGTTTILLLASKATSTEPDMRVNEARLSLICVPSAYGSVDLD